QWSLAVRESVLPCGCVQAAAHAGRGLFRHARLRDRAQLRRFGVSRERDHGPGDLRVRWLVTQIAATAVAEGFPRASAPNQAKITAWFLKSKRLTCLPRSSFDLA